MIRAEVPSVPVVSSLLANIGYDAGEWILQLEFCDGAIHQYFDVPAAIYLAAESKGACFNKPDSRPFPVRTPQPP